jgi:cytochrome c-type biogenesis protein CcmE
MPCAPTAIPMTPKRQRLMFVGLGMAALGAAGALALSALGDTLSYFRDPTAIAQGKVKAGDVFRLGGLVKTGSLQKLPDGITIRFVVTDMVHDQQVQYTGLTPDLFREGTGAVCDGRLDAKGIFIADKVLAKHDEKYMPPEVADSLKKRGVWQPQKNRPGN